MNERQHHQAKACDIFARLHPYYTDHHDKDGRIGGGDLEFFVSDLLADLRHYCDANGIDMARCDDRAHDHYLAELDGE